MKTIEAIYDKKFLKEKRKFHSKCPSIEKDFQRFETALKIQIKENDFNVPVEIKEFLEFPD